MYPEVQIFVSYVVHTWRNSVGDINAPVYTEWLAKGEKSPGVAYLMTGLIWFMWWLKQYINMIIMLNFLIAIVSQSYEDIMTN